MATVSELIAERQQAVSKDWQSFMNRPLPLSIAAVVKRRKAQLPPDFVPWAPGIVIASDYLLQVAGYTPTSGRPMGWRLQPSRGFYRKNFWVIVRNRGKFWTVEINYNVLAFIYGSMPVCTRTYEAAMWLADYFAAKSQLHFERPLGYGLRWVGSEPEGILD